MNSALTKGASSANVYGESFKALGSAADAFIFISAAVEGTTQIVGRLKEALNDTQGRLERLLKLAQQSQETGAGAGFIAALTAQFKELGVEAGTAQSILARAREASIVRQGVGGEGPVNASAIQNQLRAQIGAGNLRKGDDAAYNAAETQEQRYKSILDIMEKLEAANKRLAAQSIGKTFFGDDFEKLANQGLGVAEAFRRAAEAAKGTDAGVTSEQVERAKDLKTQSEEIAKIWQKTMKQPLADIAYLQDLAAQKSLEWQMRVAKIAEWFGTKWGIVRNIAIEIAKFAESIGLIDKDYFKIKKPGETGEGGGSTTDDAAPLVVRVRPRRGGGRPADTTKPIITGSKSGTGGAEEPDAVEQYIRQLNKARDVAQAEFEAVGKTVTERERLLALARAEAAARDDFERGRRSSPKLDDDERARTIAAADTLGDVKARTMDLEQAQRRAADTARYFGQSLSDGLADAVLEGRSLTDVFSSLEKQLARSALSAIFTGTGPLASLFGTAPAASAGPDAVGGLAGIVKGAFGEGGLFRANGGPVRAGVPYTVGEMGREMFIPNQNGRIVPIDGGPGGGGAGGGGPQTLALSVDVSGARGNQEIMSMVQAGVQAGITGYNQKLQRDLPMITARSQGRYGLPRR